MRMSSANKVCGFLLQLRGVRKICSSSSTVFGRINEYEFDPPSKPDLHRIFDGFKSSSYFASITASRHLHATSYVNESRRRTVDASDDSDGEEDLVGWEEEDESEPPELGDGGRGGGVVLNNCPWGERALSLAREVLQEFGEDMQLFAFKTTPCWYIYMRIDKLSTEYGCPRLEDIESFSNKYKLKLEEEIPDDLGLQVSSAGLDRLLRLPDDLLRFKDKEMVVTYLEDSNVRTPEKEGVYLVDSIETELECCVWKLADVKENRDRAVKGKPLSRKQREARVKLPYNMIKRVQFYIRRQ